MSYIPLPLRQLVYDRANGRCEYCLYPEHASLLAFEMEHIVSEKHGGVTEAENLALACPYCNRAKGADLASIDPETNQLTAFYNPRTQTWRDHFALHAAEIAPLTAHGRVTVLIFQMNRPERVQEREILIEAGVYP
jgi:5-methylcytosine-specific restriction endonuclease McrA